MITSCIRDEQNDNNNISCWGTVKMVIIHSRSSNYWLAVCCTHILHGVIFVGVHVWRPDLTPVACSPCLPDPRWACDVLFFFPLEMIVHLAATMCLHWVSALLYLTASALPLCWLLGEPFTSRWLQGHKHQTIATREPPHPRPPPPPSL